MSLVTASRKKKLLKAWKLKLKRKKQTEKKNRNLKQEIDSLQKKLVRLETELASANAAGGAGVPKK